MFKHGPYWVKDTPQGLRFTLRRGTYAYKRMLKREQETEGVGAAILILFIALVIFGLAAVIEYRF